MRLVVPDGLALALDHCWTQTVRGHGTAWSMNSYCLVWLFQTCTVSTRSPVPKQSTQVTSIMPWSYGSRDKRNHLREPPGEADRERSEESRGGKECVRTWKYRRF